MSLTNNLLRNISARTKNILTVPVLVSHLGGIRGKKTKSGGQTKNVSGSPPGQKYGMKCYDGQRVPKGTELLKQRRPETFPGWNVFHEGKTLRANCHGRPSVGPRCSARPRTRSRREKLQ